MSSGQDLGSRPTTWLAGRRAPASAGRLPGESRGADPSRSKGPTKRRPWHSPGTRERSSESVSAPAPGQPRTCTPARAGRHPSPAAAR